MMPSEVGGPPPLKATIVSQYPRELVGIRGIAAVYLLFKHSLAMLPPLFFSKALEHHYGVNLFMIVSGFSIYRLLDKHRPSYSRFIFGRAFRIFPVYIIGLTVSVLMLDFVKQTLGNVPSSPANTYIVDLVRVAQLHLPAHIASHVVLLQGLVPDSLLPQASYTIIGRAWSLSVEWQLYLVAPLVMVWSSTLRRRSSQVCLLGLAAAVLWSAPHLSGGFVGNNLGVLSIGGVSYAFVRAFNENRSALWLGAITLVVITTLWDVWVLPPVIVWTLTLLAATASRPEGSMGLVSKFLGLQIVQYLGRISYSFYIFHATCIILCLNAINHMGVPDAARYFALPAASLCFAILLADVAFRFVERPFHLLGKALTAPNNIRSNAYSSSLAVRLAGWAPALGRPGESKPADSQ